MTDYAAIALAARARVQRMLLAGEADYAALAARARVCDLLGA
jgi:hypothetical protein